MRIRLSQNEDYVVMMVEDDGIGIAPENHRRRVRALLRGGSGTHALRRLGDGAGTFAREAHRGLPRGDDPLGECTGEGSIHDHASQRRKSERKRRKRRRGRLSVVFLVPIFDVGQHRGHGKAYHKAKLPSRKTSISSPSGVPTMERSGAPTMKST